MKKFLIILIVFFIIVYIQQHWTLFQSGQINNDRKNISDIDPELNLINVEGNTIGERIRVPEGFERINTTEEFFGHFLRNLSLKPHGSRVRYFNGQEKTRDVYTAVVDMDIGTRDLQQCADAVIRLRAEYLYQQEQYDKIHFNFVNGFFADYGKWMQGNRISVNNNQISWVKKTGYSNDYHSFRKYLDIVFAYAGTASLVKELKHVPVEEMSIGDIFIQGGSPGHCVIVVDMAENKLTGEKIFMLAQSYMPAQDIQILKNPQDKKLNPWYVLNFGDNLITPEWTFTKDNLKRFK